MRVKKQQLELYMEQLGLVQNWEMSMTRLYCQPVHLTSMESTSCEMPGWMSYKLESRLLGGNINNLRYADDTTLMAENKEKLKSLLMRGRVGLKLSIQRTKIMASLPITSRQIEGEKVEAVTDFIFLGSKITTDSDCSHTIKRCFLLGRKVMTNPSSSSRQHIKKQRHYFADKGPSSQSYGFLVVMCGCESWTIKKAEH